MLRPVVLDRAAHDLGDEEHLVPPQRGHLYPVEVRRQRRVGEDRVVKAADDGGNGGTAPDAFVVSGLPGGTHC
jgi:hypothetical protein